MLRTALTPRWLLAAGALVAFTVVAVLLGSWQWQRTQSILEAERAAAAEPVPLAEVLRDASTGAEGIAEEVVGRPVTLSGAYVPGMQASVVNRAHGDGAGVWIVTGLRQESGEVTAVLRGSAASGDDPAAAVPDEHVEVEGVLHPNEVFYADAEPREGTVVSIDSGQLSSLWGVDLTPGYVMLGAQEPITAPAPTPMPPTVQVADVAFPLQNFFYAFQWWLFALFAWGVYARWLWLASRP